MRPRETKEGQKRRAAASGTMMSEKRSFDSGKLTPWCFWTQFLLFHWNKRSWNSFKQIQKYSHESRSHSRQKAILKTITRLSYEDWTIKLLHHWRSNQGENTEVFHCNTPTPTPDNSKHTGNAQHHFSQTASHTSWSETTLGNQHIWSARWKFFVVFFFFFLKKCLEMSFNLFLFNSINILIRLSVVTTLFKNTVFLFLIHTTLTFVWQGQTV